MWIHKKDTGVISGWDKLVLVLIVLSGSWYSIISVARHANFLSGGYDLGIFNQAIWHYSRFMAPASGIKELPNLLADHFHPALVVFAPLYWLAPRAESLLVAQAFLLTASVWPLYLFAKKRLQSQVTAVLLAASYLIFWGIRSAAFYDFHEVALAAPVLAWLLYMTAEQRWRVVVPLLVALLLIREDMALVVLFYGLYLLLTRLNWRLGLAAMVAGAGWFVLVLFYLIPALQPAGEAYTHWNYPQLGAGPGEAVRNLVRDPLLGVRLFVDSDVKIGTLILTFGAFLFLPLLSPAVVLTLPLLAARFYSSRISHVEPYFQYTAYLAPILMFATIDGLDRLTRFFFSNKKRQVAGIALAGWIVGINVYFLYSLLPYDTFSTHLFKQTPTVQAGHRAISLIPSDASVAGQDFILPHLTARRQVEVLHQEISEGGIPGPLKDTLEAEYVILSDSVMYWPASSWEELANLKQRLLQADYSLHFAEEGWYLLKRAR
jgi:uncharacterized membrane protein